MTGLDQIRAGLTAELQRLDGDRARVQQALAALSGVTTGDGGGRARRTRAPRGAVTARILDALPADGSLIRQRDLARAVGLTTQQLGGNMRRLLEHNHIERVAVGLYRRPSFAPAEAVAQ
jgi:hypothetical protein